MMYIMSPGTQCLALNLDTFVQVHEFGQMLQIHIVVFGLDERLNPSFKAVRCFTDRGSARITMNHELDADFVIALKIPLNGKLPLEMQLGVDLIYVNETMKSVVFVQYKMFAGTDGEDGYRPNDQLAIEIERMDEAAAILAGVATDESCDGYRFGSDPFFLKFCSKLLSHDTGSHVPGIYVPVGYWKRLLKAVTGQGVRGGTVVHAETFGKRYFTPTHFIDMVARGWAGTSALQTDVLAPYLRDMLAGKKGVVLAIKSPFPANPMDEDEGLPTHHRVVKPKKPRYPGRKPKTVEI